MKLFLNTPSDYSSKKRYHRCRHVYLQVKRMVYADTIGKPDVALIYADSILALIKPLSKMPPYKLNYAEELLAKGDFLFRLHLFNEAYAAYSESRSVKENAADACNKSRFFSHFYRRLADISYGKGAFEESAAWQKKALTDLSACVNTDDETYLTRGTLDNIGLSYLLAGKPDAAGIIFLKPNS